MTKYSVNELGIQLHMPIKLRDIINRSKLFKPNNSQAFQQLAQIINQQLYLKNDYSYNTRIKTQTLKGIVNNSRRSSIDNKNKSKSYKSLFPICLKEKEIIQKTKQQKIIKYKQVFTPYSKQQISYKKQNDKKGIKIKEKAFRSYNSKYSIKNNKVIISKNNKIDILKRWDVDQSAQALQGFEKQHV